MLTLNRSILNDYSQAAEYEWLETNGLGGWSGSSVPGVHTRRYHGLLVAAITPPTERAVLLSKLDETLVIGDKRIELSVNQYPDNIVHPTGHRYLDQFNKELFPQWEYQLDEIRLRKTIAMIHGENTVVVIYDILRSPGTFHLELLPLVAARGYHSLAHEGEQLHWNVHFEDGIFHNRPDGKTNLFISVPGSSFQHQPRWFRKFQYSVEKYRGLDYSEDLLNHGVFSVELREGDTVGIIVSTEAPVGRNAHELLASERKRREALVNKAQDEITRQLVLAADQFIVKRNLPGTEGNSCDIVEGATIIAGYHWFTDWARDTMISLPGLCLAIGRFDDARKILAAFAASVSMGMLPNRFQDYGQAPEYNNVDGTLWYFIAVKKYLQATGDSKFILTTILPVLKEMIDWHYRGTRFNIRVDSDGLLSAGEPGQQLTWMDARIGDWVVTPRMGKPVEVQALWYNALKIFSELLELNDQQHDAFVVNMSAEKARENFIELFWCAQKGYLFDVIEQNGEPDATLRPNQLLAISLPYPLLDRDKSVSVLKAVKEKLYTPVGLRSLPKNDSRYVPVYGGDQWHRDSSYHQGTVWSWLLGPYIDAMIMTGSKKSEAKKVIEDFSYHLNEGCVGSVSEIFDAESPHHPRGCVAQAWGVGELLRVIKEYQLFDTKKDILSCITYTSISLIPDVESRIEISALPIRCLQFLFYSPRTSGL
jgi:predicted glycogen debranching enzyme